MSHHFGPPLIPRNGHTLVVGVVARISGCAGQKELSLDDQVDHAKQVVAERYDGPVEYRVIKTKGKGERLDRPEIARIEGMLRSRELDVLVAEDIGRIVRGIDVGRICGVAVDHGTRVLAPNDCIDTADDSWEEDVISACRDHVGHNAHTSKRLKQKKMNRFKKFGGATPCEIFGYIKPLGVKTYSDWQKDEAAAATYAEWLRILKGTLNCSAVADMLNRRGVPPGPHCRRATWDGAMVRRITRNPLLKGMPGRGFRHTVKHHETGRRVSVKNPEGPVYRDYPHLAHWDPAEFDDLNARLDAANAGSGRKRADGDDPLLRVPRKRTRFPGQHARCWYCGREVVWGGNGVTENLMCNGARAKLCWNSIGFPGGLAATKVAAAIAAEFSRLEGFDDQFRALVEEAVRAGGGGQEGARSGLEADEARLARKEANWTAAVAELGLDPLLRQKHSELQAERRELARRRRDLERRAAGAPELPASTAELRRLMEETFRGLAVGSPEFGDALRLVVPEFHVYLVRLCDGGHLMPRARVVLNLAGIVPDADRAPGLGALLTRAVTLDLFEPPQRERIREEAARLAAGGLEQREIARRLPEAATQAAVSKAARLGRLMRSRGLDSPYELVPGPPEDYTKLRHHRDGKYRFEAEAGYRPPAL